LLVGISFAVFLMIQMTSLFARILSKFSTAVVNVGSRIWVIDPAVQTVANSIPMPDYVLDEVRSIELNDHRGIIVDIQTRATATKIQSPSL